MNKLTLFLMLILTMFVVGCDENLENDLNNTSRDNLSESDSSVIENETIINQEIQEEKEENLEIVNTTLEKESSDVVNKSKDSKKEFKNETILEETKEPIENITEVINETQNKTQDIEVPEISLLVTQGESNFNIKFESQKTSSVEYYRPVHALSESNLDFNKNTKTIFLVGENQEYELTDEENFFSGVHYFVVYAHLTDGTIVESNIVKIELNLENETPEVEEPTPTFIYENDCGEDINCFFNDINNLISSRVVQEKNLMDLMTGEPYGNTRIEYIFEPLGSDFFAFRFKNLEYSISFTQEQYEQYKSMIELGENLTIEEYSQMFEDMMSDSAPKEVSCVAQASDVSKYSSEVEKYLVVEEGSLYYSSQSFNFADCSNLQGGAFSVLGINS